MIWWRSPLKRLDCSAHKGESRGERDTRLYFIVSIFSSRWKSFSPAPMGMIEMIILHVSNWSNYFFSYRQLHCCMINCRSWGWNAEWWAESLLSAWPPMLHGGASCWVSWGWLRCPRWRTCGRTWGSPSSSLCTHSLSLSLCFANKTHPGSLERFWPINTWMFLPQQLVFSFPYCFFRACLHAHAVMPQQMFCALHIPKRFSG